jgi:hypothetical protein
MASGRDGSPAPAPAGEDRPDGAAGPAAARGDASTPVTTTPDASVAATSPADAAAQDARASGTDVRRDAGDEPSDGAPALRSEQKYGWPLVLVASIQKSNVVRKVYFERSAAEAYGRTGKLPDRALTFVENWSGGAMHSEVFVRQKQGTVWKNGSFPAKTPRLSLGDNDYCEGCHRLPPKEQTFGLRFLDAVLAGGKPASFSCTKQGDNAPCPAGTY